MFHLQLFQFYCPWIFGQLYILPCSHILQEIQATVDKIIIIDKGKIVANGNEGKEVWAEFKEKGNKVKKAQILYTLNGGERSEEWYVANAEVNQNRVLGTLPEGSTHYFFNLIDEKNFLVSYPVPMDMLSAGKTKPKGLYSIDALAVRVDN